MTHRDHILPTRALLAKLANISIEQARQIALKAHPGKITDEELEKERGGSGLRYSFDIKDGTKTYEVGVDANPANCWNMPLKVRIPTEAEPGPNANDLAYPKALKTPSGHNGEIRNYPRPRSPTTARRV